MHGEFQRLVSWANGVEHRHKPILIDGWMSAGKTTLAEAAAKATGGEMLDADKYLERNQGTFIRALDIEALNAAFCKVKRPILAGVCMRRIHELLGEPVSLHIYVKRMASWGWADEDEISSTPIDWSDGELCGTTPLASEVRAYHRLWNPSEIADFVYERVESWNVC